MGLLSLFSALAFSAGASSIIMVVPPGWSYGSPYFPKPVPVFSDSFFKNLSKPTRPSGRRYPGEEADFNSRQRRIWIEKCKDKKEIDFKLFRDCFETQRRRAAERRRLKLNLAPEEGDDS